MDDVYRDRQDPAVTVGLRLTSPSRELDGVERAGLDDDAVDAAVEPRRSRSARTSTTSWSSGHGRASGTSSPRPGSARTPRELGEATRGAGTFTGARAGRARATRRCSTSSSSRPAERVPGARRRLRHHRGRHRRRAHRAGVRRGRPGRHRRRRHPSVVSPVDAHGEFTAQVPPYAGHAGLRRQQADHPRPQGAPGVLLRHDTYDHSYPHCWRCDTPLVYRAVVVVVRRGDARSGTGWSS